MTLSTEMTGLMKDFFIKKEGKWKSGFNCKGTHTPTPHQRGPSRVRSDARFECNIQSFINLNRYTYQE
jgi:hypothetical protein